MYKSLTDKLLFDYYMIDSTRKHSIFSTIPFYMNENLLKTLIDTSETLDNLVQKIIKGINKDFCDFKKYIPDFKYKDDILGLTIPTSPIFWARFDAFIREDGGVFFSEFNYDKPCAQREILATEELEAKNNINNGFKLAFINSFKNIVKDFFGSKEKFNIAVLIDPCHSEEVHLSYLYKDLMEDENFNFISVGPNNLKVINGDLIAFGKEKIHVILRQFPTEYLYEVSNANEILSLYNNKKLLIMNDPRVIIGQCKSLFIYLWDLVYKNDIRLSEKEKQLIKHSIPESKFFSEVHKDYILKNKDKLVLKPIYGRYSEDVFIGVLYTEKDWIETVNYVLESKKDFLFQKFCPIHKDAVTAASKYRNIPKEGFGNLGVYLIDGKVKGFCTRWTEGYLTCDESTWITPIGISEDYLKISPSNLQDRKSTWNTIKNKAMMEFNFTGAYFRDKEYFGLDTLLLNKDKFEELKAACSDICQIFKKAEKLVSNNIDTFSHLLGIEGLNSLASQNLTNSFVFLGRMDWCLNSKGEWKLLELNSETPAGIVESVGLSELIKSELNIPYENPNKNMANMIKQEFINILRDYEKEFSIKNIGILCSTYYEDWYNTSILKDIVKDLPYNIIMGNIQDIKVKDEKINIYGTSLDAVFRYYPLDWFLKDNQIDILKALEKNTLSINPTHTIITQSKAFFALIFELKAQGFFSEKETYLIDTYLVKTSFDVDKFGTSDICVKPLLDREGNGVLLGCDISEEPSYECIFQQREDIKPLDYKTYSILKMETKLLYPIVGTYIVNDKFCGIYTRLGDMVTTSSCVYTPTFLTTN